MTPHIINDFVTNHDIIRDSICIIECHFLSQNSLIMYRYKKEIRQRWKKSCFISATVPNYNNQD